MRLAPLAAAVLASFTAAPAATLVYPSQPTAVRVIDGDTFVWNGETIRIANIDAPRQCRVPGAGLKPGYPE